MKVEGRGGDHRVCPGQAETPGLDPVQRRRKHRRSGNGENEPGQ